MKLKHDEMNRVGQAFVLVTQLSINMIVPIFLSLFIGMGLDHLLGTEWLTLIMLLLGIMASIRSMFITLRPILKGERERQDEAFQEQFEEYFKDSE